MHTQFPQKWLLPTLNENLLKAAKKDERKQLGREKWRRKNRRNHAQNFQLKNVNKNCKGSRADRNLKDTGNNFNKYVSKRLTLLFERNSL